jgi:hypothetical protein
MGLSMGHFGLKHARDRLAGDRIELTRQRDKLQSKIAALEERVAALDASLKEKADQIQAIDDALGMVFDDQSQAEARQTFPKKHLMPWGGLTRGALAMLRAANGAIRTTAEIADELAHQAGLDLPSNRDVRGFRRAVRQRLVFLSKKGSIERLHERETNEDGRWRLKATPA